MSVSVTIYDDENAVDFGRLPKMILTETVCENVCNIRELSVYWSLVNLLKSFKTSTKSETFGSLYKKFEYKVPSLHLCDSFQK